MTMDQNSSANSSLFGLSSAQFKPIVEQLVSEEKLRQFSVEGERSLQGFQGYCADKKVVIVSCITETGRQERRPLFLKRLFPFVPAEAHHYHYLETSGVPVAHLYGVLNGSQGEEILFLEYLERIGIAHHVPEELWQWLRVLVELNTVVLDENYVKKLVHHQHEQWLQDGEFLGQLLDQLEGHALRGDVGDAIQALYQNHSVKQQALLQLAYRLGEVVRTLPQGLIHGDFVEQNVGWRMQTQELLIFDLHKVAQGPRFWDIAGVLKSLLKPDAALSYQEAAHYYLERWQQRTGQALALETFLAEVEALWQITLLQSLPWHLERALDGEVDWTPDRAEGRHVYRRWLYWRLLQLVEASSLQP